MQTILLMLFVLVAAPLATFVALPALAGILVVVCWNMAEKNEFHELLRRPHTDAVLLAAFGRVVPQEGD